ncbi:MAG: hypothetical protein AB7V48_11840 [Sedimentibacter sp.]
MIKITNATEDIKVTINLEYKDITLNELIAELKVDNINIGAILVNGVPKKLTERFEDNSEIYLLPILGGG